MTFLINSNDWVSRIVIEGVDKANAQFDALEKKGEGAAAKIATGFNKVGKVLTVGVTLPIIAAGAAAVKMGIDVAESQSLVETSFKESTAAVKEWSETTSAALIQTRYDVQEQAAVFFNIAQGMGLARDMSLELAFGFTEMAADFASFFNLRPDESLDKLRAAITGEFEPLKQLGIVLNVATIEAQAYKDGIAEVGTELTTAQKAQATFNAIVERAGPAIGDVERTADSAANQIRQMQARIKETGQDIGLVLLPAVNDLLASMKPLIDDAAELARNFAAMDTEQQKFHLGMVAVVAMAGPVATGISGIISVVNTLATSLTAARLAAGGLWAILAALGYITVDAAIDTYNRYQEGEFSVEGHAANVRAAQAARGSTDGFTPGWMYSDVPPGQGPTYSGPIADLYNQVFPDAEPLGSGDTRPPRPDLVPPAGFEWYYNEEMGRWDIRFIDEPTPPGGGGGGSTTATPGTWRDTWGVPPWFDSPFYPLEFRSGYDVVDQWVAETGRPASEFPYEAYGMTAPARSGFFARLNVSIPAGLASWRQWREENVARYATQFERQGDRSKQFQPKEFQPGYDPVATWVAETGRPASEFPYEDFGIDEPTPTPWYQSDVAGYAATLAMGAAQGPEQFIGAAGGVASMALASTLGPFAPLAGLLVSQILSPMAGSNIDPVTEAIPVKVVNLKDMGATLLAQIVAELNEIAAGGIDALVNSLSVQEATVGLEAT
jgi:hypothetical protein